MKAKAFFLILFLTLFLVACDAAFTGLEVITTVRLDGSSITVMGLGFLPDEDAPENEIDCGTDDGSVPGASMVTERRGGEIWCVMTLPASSIQELQAFLAEFGEEVVKVNCLHFVDDLFVYDLDLFSGGDMSDTGSESDGVITWQVTVPGEIREHNAHSQDGNTLTWQWSESSLPSSLPINLRINTAEGESCPGGSVELALFIQEDGTGWADLVMPIPFGDESLEGRLQGELGGMGWTISSVTSPFDGPGLIKATREYDTVEGLNQIIQSVPGLAGTQASMSLELAEDEVSGLRVADFSAGRWDMAAYQAYWESLTEATAVPDFTFQVDPPGFAERTSGKWTNPDILLTEWDTSDPVKVIALSFRSVFDPNPVELSEEELQQSLEALVDRFLVEIPAGQVLTDPTFIQEALATYFSPGTINNWTNGGFACGDYQTMVLTWLDAIRRHPDPEVRAQLGGLDYGPIQAYSGGHQAVVVYPRGTDWRDTGTVLDPWPEQFPKSFTMDEWEQRFPRGIGPGQGAVHYPHLSGGESLYRNEPLPENARLHTRQIGVNSPVNVLIIAADGRRLGMLEDGTLINEIPNADLYFTPKEDGTAQWHFGLPPGEYQVIITGTDSGDYHLMVGDEQGNLVKYSAQATAPGQQASLQINPDSVEQPLQTAGGGLVMPTPVTEQNINQLDFGTPLTGQLGNFASGESPQVPLGSGLLSEQGSFLDTTDQQELIGLAAGGLLGLLGCILGLAAVGLLLFALLRRR